MGPPSAATTTQSPSELRLLGLQFTPQQVGWGFVAVCLFVLGLGMYLNDALTGGDWKTEGKQITSALGSEATYLTDSAYDVTTQAILSLALLLLGAGYIASRRPRLASPLYAGLVGLAIFFLAAYSMPAQLGLSPTTATLFLTAGIVFGFFALAWTLGLAIGTGPAMHYVRAAGFVLFSLYWAANILRLYIVEQGDWVNAGFAAFAVFFFNYFAYHELLSVSRGEDPRSLQWLAGASFLVTGVYVATHKIQVVSEWLILVVAKQTTYLLQSFGQEVYRCGGDPGGSLIYYIDPRDPHIGCENVGFFPIQIILACTAIQSIMIFVGGIGALKPPQLGDGVSGRPGLFDRLQASFPMRRLFALMLTVPLIYALNLFRNFTIIALSGKPNPWFFTSNQWATDAMCNVVTRVHCNASDASFWFTHNIIGKGGSLIALIIIAFMVFQILPELYDSFAGLIDLKRRRGPLERWYRQLRGLPEPQPRRPSGEATMTPPPTPSPTER